MAEGITSKEAKEDVAYGDGSEGIFVIFWHGSASSGIEVGYGFWWDLPRGNRVKNSGGHLKKCQV